MGKATVAVVQGVVIVTIAFTVAACLLIASAVDVLGDSWRWLWVRRG